MLMLEKNKGLKLVSAAFIYFFKYEYERANKTQHMQKENNKEQKSE